MPAKPRRTAEVRRKAWSKPYAASYVASRAAVSILAADIRVDAWDSDTWAKLIRNCLSGQVRERVDISEANRTMANKGGHHESVEL